MAPDNDPSPHTHCSLGPPPRDMARIFAKVMEQCPRVPLEGSPRFEVGSAQDQVLGIHAPYLLQGDIRVAGCHPYRNRPQEPHVGDAEAKDCHGSRYAGDCTRHSSGYCRPGRTPSEMLSRFKVIRHGRGEGKDLSALSQRPFTNYLLRKRQFLRTL